VNLSVGKKWLFFKHLGEYLCIFAITNSRVLTKKKAAKKKTSKFDLEKLDREALERLIIKQRNLIEDQAELIRDLDKIIDKQKGENQELQKQVRQLQSKRSKLLEEIDELTRQLHRPAAPFRIPEERRSKKPKKPGRRKGHSGSYRKSPEEIDEYLEVPLYQCPQCSGQVTEVKKVDQYIEEIPEPKVEVTHLVTYRGKCTRCGVIETDHPLKVSQASGAAKCHLGPRAQAMAVALQYDYNLTKSKVSRLLSQLYGLDITPGGLVHLSHRIGARCQSDYTALEQEAKHVSVLHADETSWYVGSPNYFLWFFGNSQMALYSVIGNRKRENIERILGENFEGVLVSDCLVIYDDVNETQQKCYAHHLKEINKALKICDKESEVYLDQLRSLLKTAIILKSIKGDIRAEQYDEGIKGLERTAESLLAKSRQNVLEEKIANRLRKQKDHLFTFLKHPQVDATNNLAERMLRPAVISRKVSCGNKTIKGAKTWEILTSVIQTNRLRGIENMAFLTQKAQGDYSNDTR